MHEASIAESMIETVTTLMQEGQIQGKVRKVHVKIGKMTAVVCENLRFIFSVLTEEGPLMGAELEIEEVDVRGHCRACGQTFLIAEPRFSCQKCGAIDIEIVSGRELMVHAVEVD